MGTPFVLPEALTIYTVSELQPQLLHYLQALVGPARLEAAAVQEVDSAGLQLLQALAMLCQRQGRALQLMQASAAFSGAAAALGLQGLLQDTSRHSGLECAS